MDIQKESELVFIVLAGSWDDQYPNCKFAGEFSTLQEALEEYEQHNTRHWACIEVNGLVIEGCNPMRD